MVTCVGVQVGNPYQFVGVASHLRPLVLVKEVKPVFFFFFSINNFKSVLGSNIKIKANTLKSAKPYGHVIDNVVVPTMLYSHTMQMLIP